MATKNEAGFTLIEILLAILVLSLMMGLVYEMTNKSTETADRIIAEDKAYMQVQTAFSIFKRDLTSIYNPLYTEVKDKTKGSGDDQDSDSKNFDGVTHLGKIIPVIKNPDKSKLIFMTYSNKRKLEDIKQSKYAWVRYSLRKMEKQSDNDINKKGEFELIRQYSADDPFAEDFAWDDIKAHTLISNIKELQFSFWNSDKNEYDASLSDLNQAKQQVSLIKLELIWIDKNGNENSVDKSVRPIWPQYDASKEIKKEQNITNSSKKGPSIFEASDTNTTNSLNDDDDDDDDDDNDE